MADLNKYPIAQTARQFPTGANRSDDSRKLDYEGYLSPLVLERFAHYMYEHQYDGARASDNWQKGIPATEYLKSLLRHVLDLWLWHRGYGHIATETKEEALCAIFFNTQGYLHETLLGREESKAMADVLVPNRV